MESPCLDSHFLIFLCLKTMSVQDKVINNSMHFKLIELESCSFKKICISFNNFNTIKVISVSNYVPQYGHFDHYVADTT